MERCIDRESLALMLMCWHVGRVCVHGLAPSIDQGHAYDRAKNGRTSVCIETLVILCGL
jgi:hypothetical protein